jgi:hypothetical protein
VITGSHQPPDQVAEQRAAGSRAAGTCWRKLALTSLTAQVVVSAVVTARRDDTQSFGPSYSRCRHELQVLDVDVTSNESSR